MTKLKITDLAGFENIPNKAGYYKIAIEDSNSKRLTINRVVGEDILGVLYIGRSTNLYERLNNFKRVIETHRGDMHIAAERYNDLPILETKYPRNNILIDYFVTDEHITGESEALKEYSLRHGELPPLNRSH